MDCTVHGILQAGILEWVAIPFSRRSSQPREQTQVSHIAGRFFTIEATGSPKENRKMLYDFSEFCLLVWNGKVGANQKIGQKNPGVDWGGGTWLWSPGADYQDSSSFNTVYTIAPLWFLHTRSRSITILKISRLWAPEDKNFVPGSLQHLQNLVRLSGTQIYSRSYSMEEREGRKGGRKNRKLLTSNSKIPTPLGKTLGLQCFLIIRKNFKVQNFFWGNCFETNLFYYICTVVYLTSGVVLVTYPTTCYKLVYIWKLCLCSLPLEF